MRRWSQLLDDIFLKSLSCLRKARPLLFILAFRYVADVDIRHASKDRSFYFLVYGTHEPAGIEVFRDSQVKALEAQAEAAGQRTQGNHLMSQR